MRRPTKADLAAAHGTTIPDLLAPGLRVLFCGINPGLYSGYTGHHFSRPGNRFWPALHASGFTPRLLRPEEQHLLPGWGLGITNLVARATARADELSGEELKEGGEVLADRLRTYRPAVLGVLGVTAYRQAFGRPRAEVGLQSERIADTPVWVLPNPSGLNAHWSAAGIAEELTRMRRWAFDTDTGTAQSD
ncbi:G/U mismatch-specific DNA glycosylase [Marinactinospora thermotolerans]|uniref:G/U mismatch-specific uracil-DNA glycosylase n=1 Tax=Marinactinospora thermotolerans DSM 45154 TaxID=1122192 RepID=A0A1T4S6I8_9ACTN|nr:G/U mismatch-specific DNA glycosylase [Marinactinospora thermotolerans]SKA23864.1 G/U mismatch-specific uracil-DNA glycosylase [Marinactinospora thermotolerans DSM 45154]